MILPIEIAHFELKNLKFSGRRRRPKILASGADLRNLSSETKGGFLRRGGFLACITLISSGGVLFGCIRGKKSTFFIEHSDGF